VQPLYRDEPHVSTSKVNVFECLFTRAMDYVEATGEGSQNVGALVTCGFFYIVATTREPHSSGDFSEDFEPLESGPGVAGAVGVIGCRY
jgi:hypothetical protein